MVVNSSRPLWGILAELWVQLLPVTGYIVVISLLDLQFHFEEVAFPFSVLAVLGTVIGLLLAFRTNSAYARWWEARILWGAIVNDSRSWTRQVMAFQSTQPEPGDELVREMVYRQAAWCFALARFLRKQDELQDLSPFLSEEDMKECGTSKHVPNTLLQQQTRRMYELRDQGKLDSYSFIELERTLVRLTNSMGGCERIRNTPFPRSYSRIVDGMMFVFVILLPFGLTDMPAPALIATAIILSFAFLLVDRLAIFLQDPFSNRPSDTPVLALSRNIEINLRQMIGETELPEKIEPVRGVLY